MLWSTSQPLFQQPSACISYSVKAMISKKKSQYTNHKLPDLVNFTYLTKLKDSLRKITEQVVNSQQMSYIKPGHGAKGRQMWLNTDEDLKDMYKKCAGKR